MNHRFFDLILLDTTTVEGYTGEWKGAALSGVPTAKRFQT